LLAATMRESKAMGELLAPSRRNSRSSMARSSLGWRSSARSPISSRKSVPPCARSRQPIRWLTAPVKAPFSWPKSSLSIRLSLTAAQSKTTSGPSRRGDS
jgi:hypothetical protein